MWKDVLASCPNIRSFDLNIQYFGAREGFELSTNGSLKDLRLLMRARDIKEVLVRHLKWLLYNRLMSTIKKQARFPSLDCIELHGSGWASIYKESLSELQQAAEHRQLSLSFESPNL